MRFEWQKLRLQLPATSEMAMELKKGQSLGVGPAKPISDSSRKAVAVAVTVTPAGGKRKVVVSPAKDEA